MIQIVIRYAVILFASLTSLVIVSVMPMTNDGEQREPNDVQLLPWKIGTHEESRSLKT